MHHPFARICGLSRDLLKVHLNGYLYSWISYDWKPRRRATFISLSFLPQADSWNHLQNKNLLKLLFWLQFMCLIIWFPNLVLIKVNAKSHHVKCQCGDMWSVAVWLRIFGLSATAARRRSSKSSLSMVGSGGSRSVDAKLSPGRPGNSRWWNSQGYFLRSQLLVFLHIQHSTMWLFQ